MVTANPATAVSRARARASGALRSEPVASTSKPPRIGIQIARLRRGIPVIVTFRSVRRRGGAFVVIQDPSVPRSAAVEPEGQQHEYADDHREGVLVDVAGLEQAAGLRHPAHQLGGAI